MGMDLPINNAPFREMPIVCHKGLVVLVSNSLVTRKMMDYTGTREIVGRIGNARQVKVFCMTVLKAMFIMWIPSLVTLDQSL